MTQMATNSERLLKLFDDWDSDFAGMCAAFRLAFAPNCIWENAGMDPVHGYAEAYEKVLLPSNSAPLSMDAIRVETRTIMEQDNVVIHERIDHLLRADGSVIISIGIAGVTEYDSDGLIAHWRDYCDPTALHVLMSSA
jgi:limonene-1,2-epoxide hydrolase